MPLGLMLPNSFNRLLIALSKQFLNKRTVHIKRFQSVFTRYYLNIFFANTFFVYFQHVVLVGGFAASDWLFSKVYELLTPVGLNVVRPENHVWVVLQKIKTTLLFKKERNCLETKRFRMAQSHFTSTTSWELVFLKWHMVPFIPSHTIQVTQTIYHGVTRCSSILFLGLSGSEIYSISSYPKWVV